MSRTLRTISFIEGLQVLVIALIDTIRKSVLNVVILLVLLMIFFGVVGYYIFGYDETGDLEKWGDLSKAMLTLFTFVTVSCKKTIENTTLFWLHFLRFGYEATWLSFPRQTFFMTLNPSSILGMGVDWKEIGRTKVPP